MIHGIQIDPEVKKEENKARLVKKVARTIADLEGHETIRTDHLAEAIQYRTLDRRTGW